MAHVSANGGPIKSEQQQAPPAKPSRPNYNVLHSWPLPIQVNPLPPLIPHNPLSLIYFAYAYISSLWSPPSSHITKYRGYFSPETRSVHVTDEEAVRGLWEKGFFGKGSLSRSEPSWLDREKRRRGIVIGETSEEITRKRREERKEFKNKRARKEREAIEQKLQQENKSSSSGHSTTVLKVEDNNSINPDCNGLETPQANITGINHPPISAHSTIKDDPSHNDKNFSLDSNTSSLPSAAPSANIDEQLSVAIKDEEHLQLTSEEAFFLNYGLGVLEIDIANSSTAIPADVLFSLFRQYSYFPPREAQDLQPDDPFLISYTAYHHFRSLGWVVRSGVKFAVDYLLYNRGPVFSHAEFALIVLPSYSHRYWHATAEREMETKKKESKSWWWLHSVNRVQGQVRKSLVLVYVEVPPPQEPLSRPLNAHKLEKDDGCMFDIGQVLKRYKIREFSLKRWIPNRSRD